MATGVEPSGSVRAALWLCVTMNDTKKQLPIPFRSLPKFDGPFDEIFPTCRVTYQAIRAGP